MSWTRVSDPHAAFKQASADHYRPPDEKYWEIEIWEGNEDAETIHPRTERDPDRCAGTKASFRVIFAPLDLPRVDSLQQLLGLFQVLSVPREFSIERVQSVAHSFGTRVDDNGTSMWFHFLCKRIVLHSDCNENPHPPGDAEEQVLPLADYSWHRSGFFLQTSRDEVITLACFGATERVRSRLVDFMQMNRWRTVQSEPLLLFDLILDGLFLEVDETLWSMADLFGPLEHNILVLANSGSNTSISRNINFAELHNCAKHNMYIAEAIESMLLLVDRICAQVEASIKKAGAEKTDPAKVQLLDQLARSLDYRRSLFQSTQLRQTSLQKRIDIAITLSFNLVTQQDSMVMIQDSNSMKTIAAITMVFLPTTTVAAVLGSQLFASQMNDVDGSWTVEVTPPFRWLWWISIPMTILVAVFAWLWRVYKHRKSLPPFKHGNRHGRKTG